MNKTTAKVLGVIIGGLALVGLFRNGHWLGLMNVDVALDLLRIVLAGTLLYVGFSRASEESAASVVMTVGGLYVGMAILGLLSRELFGLLPSGLTNFDLAFHALTGVAAVAIASRVGMHTGSPHRI